MKEQLNSKPQIKTLLSNQWKISQNVCALTQSLRHLSWSPTSPKALPALTAPKLIYVQKKETKKNPL